jgi:DegV family protein with EDD domain
MAKVGIITDTIACLTQEMCKEYDIGILPIPLNINGKAYRDQVELRPEAFWKMFKDIKEFTTGAPPLGDYINVYKTISEKTDEIVCIFVSQKLSAIYETGIQAADMLKKENPKIKIELIDSQTAAGAQGFIVLEMARAAAAGKNLTDVIQVGQDMIKRAKFLCGMETLRYLIKSGRAPKTAYMGEFFQVKPIIGMVNNTGLVENIGRARGKQACLEMLPKLMEKYIDTSKPLHINVHYSDDINVGRQLKELVESKYNCVELYMTPYTPVMCGHTGPVFAMSFYS